MGFTNQIAGDIYSMGMGLIAGQFNDRRQYEQQARLQELQLKGMKEMTDYNRYSQLQMWKDTNYEAQVREMNKAGINPALLYAKGGPGGVTGAGGSNTVSSATAAGSTNEIMQGMALQKARVMAETENINADTELKKVEANKKSGPDTKLVEQTIENLAQELSNLREDYEIKRLDQAMKHMENWEKQATQASRMKSIEYATATAFNQLEIIKNEKKVSDATVQAQIDLIKSKAIGEGLRNLLTSAQTAKTRSDIQVNEKQINMWIQQNMRDWDKMSQENQKIALQDLLIHYQIDPNKDAMHNISNLIDNIFFLQPKVHELKK